MTVKQAVKELCGLVRCWKFGVKHQKGVYVGGRVHFVNGENVELGVGVQIRPDCDLFAGEVFKIGKHCDIGTRNRIVGNVIIEDSVLFGPDNSIASHDHIYTNTERPILE